MAKDYRKSMMERNKKTNLRKNLDEIENNGMFDILSEDMSFIIPEPETKSKKKEVKDTKGKAFPKKENTEEVKIETEATEEKLEKQDPVEMVETETYHEIEETSGVTFPEKDKEQSEPSSEMHEALSEPFEEQKGIDAPDDKLPEKADKDVLDSTGERPAEHIEETQEDTPVDANGTECKREPLTDEKCNESERMQTITWNCELRPDLIERFTFEVYMRRTSAQELINRILKQEQEWEEAHPEFFTKEYIIGNIRNAKTLSKEERATQSFNLLPENKAYLKESSFRRGMKMYAMISELIDAYCSK